MKKSRLISGDGYYMIQTPKGYKGKTYIGNRYVLEHRYLMEQKLDRLLLHGEIVHHKNGNRLDNRLNNLELLLKEQHDQHHSSLRKKKNNATCNNCSKSFGVAPYKLKRRELFCSRDCYRKACNGRHD